MKYVAIIDTKDEFSEDIINTLKLTFFMGTSEGESYCFDFDSIKKVPESKPKFYEEDEEYDDNYFARYYKGYNQALKDCGIEKEN